MQTMILGPSFDLSWGSKSEHGIKGLVETPPLLPTALIQFTLSYFHNKRKQYKALNFALFV